MKKKLRILLISLLSILLLSVPTFANPVISLQINGNDSSINPIDIPLSGTLDVSILVSEINSEDVSKIYELQFDAILPDPLVWSGTPTYGDAVTHWLYKQGGILSSNHSIYREFSAELSGKQYPLSNGTLVSGLKIELPDGMLPGFYTIEFGKILGTNHQCITFKNVTLSAVPIPATAILFLSGIFGLVGIRKFKAGKLES